MYKQKALEFIQKGNIPMDRNKFTDEVLQAETTLYRVAKSILIRESDCEDAVQETLLKAYMKLGTLREEKYFKTWLVRILINECYRIKRTGAKIVPLYECEEISASDGLNKELYNAVMKLKTPVRLAVVLHYIEGYNVSEVGRILKIPAGTVKSRLHAARKMLKEELESE